MLTYKDIQVIVKTKIGSEEEELQEYGTVCNGDTVQCWIPSSDDQVSELGHTRSQSLF